MPEPLDSPSPPGFSADEAQRIFARAARRQHAARVENGLTLDDLVAIGQEAGLDPDLIAAEAEAAHQEGDAPDDGRRVRILPTDVTDGEWERIVDLLRDETGGPGVAQRIGRRREWTGPPSTALNVLSIESVRVEEVGGRTQLTIVPRDVLSSQKMVGWILPLVLLANAALYGPIAAIEGRPGLGLGIAAVLVVLAAFLGWLVPFRLRSRARVADDKLDALLDRIDLAARAEDAPPARLGEGVGRATEAGRIDAALLEDGPPGDSTEQRRERARP